MAWCSCGKHRTVKICANCYADMCDACASQHAANSQCANQLQLKEAENRKQELAQQVAARRSGEMVEVSQNTRRKGWVW